MAIYLNTAGKEFKDITEIITFGYDGGYIYFKPTYSDPECTKLQCHQARRSFSDLLELCQTYFPETTKEQLAYVLLNKVENLNVFFCNDIRKFVFESYLHTGICRKSHYHEKGKIGLDNYSLEQIEKLAQDYEYLHQ